MNFFATRMANGVRKRRVGRVLLDTTDLLRAEEALSEGDVIRRERRILCQRPGS